MDQDLDNSQFHRAARVGEVIEGSGQAVIIDDQQIALFKCGGQIYATSDICPHRGAPLAEGFLEAGKVFCPWHCFDFDLKTGACSTVPSLSIQTYEVKIADDEIWVAVEK